MDNILLSGKKFEITLERLCYQIIENHNNLSNTALIGLQPRGIYLANALYDKLVKILGNKELKHGNLDATFHRDDFRSHKGPLIPSSANINFAMEGMDVILADDVLFTGRTIRAGLDALLDYGRPKKVELLVLVDRVFSRQLPIEPNYVGIAVDTRASQKVKVTWQETEGENSVCLLTDKL